MNIAICGVNRNGRLPTNWIPKIDG